MTKTGTHLVIDEPYQYRGSNTSSWSTGRLTHADWYTLNSSSNGRDWRSQLGPSSDVGNAFFLDAQESSISPGRISHPLYVGRWYPQQSNVGAVLQQRAFYTVGELFEMGTNAISELNPTKPAFSLITSLGELAKDGLPALFGANLWRERSHLARGASGEFLNAEFGWKPLISDIQKFARTVKDSEHIIDQYRRDSGRPVRRRRIITDVTDSAHQSASQIAAPSRLRSHPGIEMKTRREEVWFSGAFRYHIPVSDSALSTLQEHVALADKLLGVVPTPEALWNLSPWSWAIDWFTNTGSIMSNISNLGPDGSVLQYGYIMNRRIETVTRFAKISDDLGGSTASMTVKTKRLRRYKATPFGFGADLSGITPKQASILAAIGMSRR